MAHQLTRRANGFVEMAYAGEKAWHRLGNELQFGASIEQWKQSAGMDWNVEKAVIAYAFNGETKAIDDRFVLHRSDNGLPLGIVSPQFKIVQPGEVLEFFRDLCEANGFILETAGTLFGGKRFWALARIGATAVIAGGVDMVGGYVLLSTGCDGTIPTTASFTTIRVVCNNTLSMALNRKEKSRITIGHRSVFDADAVKNQLGIARGEFSKFVAAMRDLSKKTVTERDAAMLTLNIVAPAEFEAGQGASMKTLESKPYNKILALFKGDGMGATLNGSAGTAWGWVNAITEYTDHHARAHTADNRMNAAFFGKGDDLKTRAVELAMAL
ncbi:MAG: phage/plasmid-like protein [Marmoricola sp.]|nr:phage/plasmid-like protein [Marmoricola sp.]